MNSCGGVTSSLIYHWSLSTGLDSEMLDVNVDEVVPAEE